MKINELLLEIKKRNIHVQVENGELKVSASKGVLTKDIVAQLKDKKKELIKLLSVVSYDPIPKSDIRSKYPLTSTQKRFWILNQFKGGDLAYNISSIIELEGDLDLQKLERAFSIIIDRHESLRTQFQQSDSGEVFQQVTPMSKIKFSIEIKDRKEEENIDSLIKEEFNHPFDLEDGLLLNVSLIRKSENKYVLIFLMHHIISDDWSMGILTSEVISVYSNLIQDKPVELTELSIQYKDYSSWLESSAYKEVLKKQKQFWLDKFSGELTVLNIPSPKARPLIKTYNGSTIFHEFSSSFLEKLKSFSKKVGSTKFMVLMAGLNGLFYRYTGQRDIIIGTLISGREHPDLVNQIGVYINILAIRTEVKEESNFEELIKTQKENLLEAFSNQKYPFDELVDNLKLKRDASRSALFDIMVVYKNQEENTSTQNKEAPSSLRIKPYENIESKSSQLDIMFYFLEHDDKLKVDIEFNTDIYDSSFIKRMLNHFEIFLLDAIESPTKNIENLTYLSKAESNKLLNNFNETSTDYPKEKTIIELFENQVKRTPDAIAIQYKEQQLTYLELNEKSNQLAHFLKGKCKPNESIGIYLDRSLEMMIGILGVLKSGGSYLPLDPNYPISRITYMVKHSKLNFIITKRDMPSVDNQNGVLEVILLEDVLESENSNANIEDKLDANSLAYIIYTSGSTGNPKGVMISHQNVMNFFVGMNQHFEYTKEQQSWLAVTSMSFDISVLELLWTLTNGNKVVLQPDRPLHVTESADMDFSLFYFAAHAERGSGNKYELLLEGAKFADTNGLKAVWVPERHFHDFGDHFPNPSIAAAAISSITKNIRIRSGSVVLPLHDVVRVAEDWSMVDNLSEGRAELSIASGWHPNDFVLKPDVYKSRHSVMRENLSTLKDLWKGKSIVRKNGIGNDFEFKIHPEPIQDNLPVWITSGGSPETFKYAGSIGANILTHHLAQSIEDLTLKIEVYRKSLKDNGFDPKEGKVALMLHTFISDDLDFVEKTVENPFKNYLRNSLNLMKPLADEAGLDIENDIELIIDVAYNRFYKTNGLFGTPESCLLKIQEYSNIGIDEVACLIDFGIDTKTTLDSLKHLSHLQRLVKQKHEQSKYQLKRLDESWSTEQLIEKYNITHLQTTPSLVNDLIKSELGQKVIGKLDTLLVGGEAFPMALANRLLKNTTGSIYNMYGPTESTIWSSVKEISEDDDVITIGKPIANTQIYVLDPYEKLCAIGVIGELYIGGDGVSPGYLYNDKLTKDRFINNPFIQNQKIYKTGDLAKWLPNGEIVCFGRLDTQIKLNGYRIELGEIEKSIESFSDVIMSVVIVKPIEDFKQLVAFVKVDKGFEKGNLFSYLTTKLPAYMIPSLIVPIEEFPLTPNGKIDRKSLVDHKIKRLKNEVIVNPENKTEEIIVKIWSDFLKLESISVLDNFFEIGGNSIKVIQLIAIINKKLNLELNITALFQYPSIRGLSNYILENDKGNDVIIDDMEQESLDEMIDFMNEI